MAKDKGADKEEEEKPDETDGGEVKTKGKKGLIIIIAVVLLLLIGGAAAYFLVFAGDDKKDKATTEESSEEDAEEGDHEEESTEGEEEEGGEEGGEEGKKADKGPIYYDLPEFLVNLTSPTKQTSFLKMKVTLELKKKKDIKAVEKALPRITDSFNTYLRELRPDDLRGSAGMYRLRDEMILRINQSLAPVEIKSLLFKEVIVQ